MTEKIKRTAQDYAGLLEELKNAKTNRGYLCIRGRYKGELGRIILNEFLEGKNGRPELFTKRDILQAIYQAGGREFTDYEYDGHRWEPDGYFVDDILKGCAKHGMMIEKYGDYYRRKLSEVLKDKDTDNIEAAGE